MTGGRRPARPVLRCLPGVCTAAHQLFEVGAGSGVIGQARVGLPAAAALSALVDAAWVAAALDRRRRWSRSMAAGAGGAIAAAALHYTLFPWSLRRGLPVLTEAEGLQGRPLAAYQGLLYCWALAGAAALADSPAGRRRWALAGMPAALAFRQLAREHLVWIRQEARRNPAWWNRAWAEAQRRPHRIRPHMGLVSRRDRRQRR